MNIVFDLDGTLIDSAPQIHDAASTVFLAKGFAPFPFETVRNSIGNGVGVLVQRLMAFQGLDATPALHAELVESFVKIYEEAFDKTTLYPGVSTVLTDLLTAGHHLAICTNKPAGPTRAVLRHFGLHDAFRVIVGGDTLPQRKPHPAPLHAAMDPLGPGKAVFVGDSEVDAETSRAASVPFALFSGGYRRTPAESLGARIVFDNHAALPRLITHVLPRL